MIRPLLICLFSGILLAMLAVTTHASLDRSIFDVGSELTADPWFQATLADAYFGFLTFYVWVAFKERKAWSKIVWFVLIMTLGNIAISVYVLIQLWNWDVRQGARAILLRSDFPQNRTPGA